MKPQARYTDRFVRALSVRQDYELHKKKISKIFREKGPYAMTTDSSKLQELKQRKQSDLERVRNQRLKSIEKNNSLMFERLIGSQELYRGTSVANATIAYIKESTSGRTPRLDKPYVHQVLKNAEVENSRIFHRLAKLKSTIDRRKTESEYQAAKKHKERISRFEGGEMKKNNYVSREISRKKFGLSASSRSSEKDKFSSTKDVKSTSSVIYRGNQIGSYYTPQGIYKNRIQQPNILNRNRLKQLHRISFRPFNNKLCMDIKNFMDENITSEQTRFFTTQIQSLNRNLSLPNKTTNLQ